MKKYNLFKILGIVIFVYFILTWILSANYYSGGLQELGKYQMSIPMLWQIPFQSIGYFSSTFMFILAVGALYGVLEATGVYRKVLDKLVLKLKKHKLLWLILIMFVVAAISSIAGLELAMFLFFPFLISLIILMGYDKLIALVATLGSTIVGMFGSTFSYTAYGANNYLLGTTMLDGILMKVILFVLGFGLLVLFTILYINKNGKKGKEKNSKTKDKNKKEQNKEKEEEKEKALEKFIPLATDKKTDKKIWPFVVIISLLFVILTVATISWTEAFKISLFSKIHNSIMSYTISDFAIFSKLLSGAQEFGTLAGPTRFLYYTGIILVFSIIIALVYRIKVNDYFKAVFEGAKRYIKTAFLVMLVYSVLVIVTSYPIFLTIAKGITGDTFNIATTGLATILGSGLYIDLYYYPQYVLQFFAGLQNADVNILNVLFVSMYSAVMLVVPTSALLVATLDTFDVSYKDWLKFIWKLFLALIILAFVVITIFSLI